MTDSVKSNDSSPGNVPLQQLLVPTLLSLSYGHSIVVRMAPGIAHTSICPSCQDAVLIANDTLQRNSILQRVLSNGQASVAGIINQQVQMCA